MDAGREVHDAAQANRMLASRREERVYRHGVQLEGEMESSTSFRVLRVDVNPELLHCSQPVSNASILAEIS